MKLRLTLGACLLLTLGACTETRFESPPGDRIEACDAGWKGLWVDASGNASKDEPDELAFLVDSECQFQMIERPEKDGPPKLIHVPLNFVHDRGKHYLVVADDQLSGVVKVDPVYGVDPVPEKSFYLARYELKGERMKIFGVDSTRAAHRILDKDLEGTIDSRKNDLHVFVQGDRARILEILRKYDLFEAKPGAEVRKVPLSLEDYERKRTARREAGKS
ncbi:hypothetical protein [Dokdonella immobilis]|uniref:Uncharacterized protein n=1 Tax=Dokdonella immobilis TaxID=578942 RepID=A0A1I4WN06_9GAMM|nr:hypothetical protein [Dokdonella immobilis]SFN14379.1 hypothetical protein SAMN05216289_105132 [Dokdonella immobilis]